MKKVLSVFVLLVFAIPFSTSAEVMQGDVDGSGKVNIADVTELIDYLLSGDVSTINLMNADVDGDGNVGIADVTELIDMILSGATSEEHEYVDLGLPSGTLWATCNIGASKPEEYGDYFAWGETEPKATYSWSTYKYGTYETPTKYNNSDNLRELELTDDAAYVNWGPSWRIPSKLQIRELFNNCSVDKSASMNGVKGFLFTGSNGNTLFLPAAGVRWDSSFSGEGSIGRYWSNSIHEYKLGFAYFLDFEWSLDYGGRNFGFSVRAVSSL